LTIVVLPLKPPEMPPIPVSILTGEQHSAIFVAIGVKDGKGNCFACQAGGGYAVSSGKEIAVIARCDGDR
jgi:hypothetical protein